VALVRTYFGGAARQQLESELYEEYVAIGKALTRFAREVSTSDRGDAEGRPIGRRLTSLGHKVSEFNVRLLDLLQSDQLGRAAPDAELSPQGATPVLQFGHQGTAVRRLQRALRRAGEHDGRADGLFGERTEAAVRSAQRSASLDVDGVVGAQTWDALPCGAPMPTLREGTTGEVVASLQAVLAHHAPSLWEISPGDPAATFGAATADAVRAFQRWNGLSSDGVVGDTTWAASVGADGQTLEVAVGLKHVRE
jgi:murein L,D-transpeptidase YcbB/YkuD